MYEGDKTKQLCLKNHGSCSDGSTSTSFRKFLNDKNGLPERHGAERQHILVSEESMIVCVWSFLHII